MMGYFFSVVSLETETVVVTFYKNQERAMATTTPASCEWSTVAMACASASGRGRFLRLASRLGVAACLLALCALTPDSQRDASLLLPGDRPRDSTPRAEHADVASWHVSLVCG
jgi:hypothetical protein